MIVIIASRHDAVASALLQRWKSHNVRLLTAEDLSTTGWRYFPHDVYSSTAVIGGQEVAAQEISGVLTRLSGVPQQELGHIIAADRAYVAVEMTAFLLAWLTSFSGPVLNRPTPTCLSGPGWRREQWTYAAARVGIPISPVERREYFGRHQAVKESAANIVTITVVGKRCIGEGHTTLAQQAQRLAATAGTNLLSVDFSSSKPGALFVSANPFPNLADDEVAHAILKYFQEERDYATPVCSQHALA
ncbi:hypothetical protein I8748_05400 [Nostoc sp. CENA67]|uniref:Uncharacterized protein n=1 Tax=Amazonocrinis nigriterrae CENA67 TaxID=2794033 RepID=A0A8J7HQ30_9NOST|nr:hypothetical protein [Amazonocrinis nigriterrae]MBH8561618.1 hypothetical protein [Amazonocrinis nigriterrae CENA67]